MQQDLVCLNKNDPAQLIIRQACPDDIMVSYQMEILIRRRPCWLPPCHLVVSDQQKHLCYELYGLRPLKDYKDYPDPRFGRSILEQLCLALAEASDLLLPLEQFLFNESLLFLDKNNQIRLIFSPFKLDYNDAPFEQDSLVELLKAIGCLADGPDNMISSLAQFIPEDPLKAHAYLKSYVYEFDRETNQDKIDNSAQRDKTAADKLHKGMLFKVKSILFTAVICLNLFSLILIAVSFLDAVQLPFKIKHFTLPVVFVDLCILVIKNKNFLFEFSSQTAQKIYLLAAGAKDTQTKDGSTEILPDQDSGFRMAMLSEGEPGTAGENDGLRAFILAGEFLIGRDPQKVDFCLADSAIGRCHARIIRRAGSFFIVDLGSVNGTFINNKRLAKQTETLLPDQCQVSFGRHCFYFQAD